jgi:hypothetical protein
MPTQRPNRARTIFMRNGSGRRHGASFYIFTCRPSVWRADYLDAMLRLSPRGEIAPPWRDINERTRCAVKAQCTCCRAQNDALRTPLETIRVMTCESGRSGNHLIRRGLLDATLSPEVGPWPTSAAIGRAKSQTSDVGGMTGLRFTSSRTSPKPNSACASIVRALTLMRRHATQSCKQQSLMAQPCRLSRRLCAHYQCLAVRRCGSGMGRASCGGLAWGALPYGCAGCSAGPGARRASRRLLPLCVLHPGGSARCAASRAGLGEDHSAARRCALRRERS